MNTQSTNTTLDSVLTAYRPRLTAFIAKMTRNERDVEDLVQETLIKVARNWNSFRGESTLSSWVFQIASNVCVDYFRVRSSKLELYQEESKIQASSSEGILRQIEKKEVDACVYDGIANLFETDRRILIMYYMDGTPVKEIAVAEGISTNSAKVRLHRARKRFRDSCASSCDVSSDETGEVSCSPKGKDHRNKGGCNG